MSPRIMSGFSPASMIASAPPSTPTSSGLRVADVGAQRAQVAPVGRAADDDQHVAVAEVGPRLREVEPAREQLGLALDVLDRVAREVGDRLVDGLLLLGEPRPELVASSSASPRAISSPFERISSPSTTIGCPSSSSSNRSRR